MANDALKLANTEAGTAIVQWGLLTGALGGFGTLVATVIPKVITAFSAIPDILAAIIFAMNGMTAEAGIMMGGISGVASVAVPAAAAIAAIAVAIWKIKEAYDEAHSGVSEFTNNLKTLQTEYDSNKQKLEELNKTPYANRSAEIEKEVAELEIANAKLREKMALEAKSSMRQGYNVVTDRQYEYTKGIRSYGYDSSGFSEAGYAVTGSAQFESQAIADIEKAKGEIEELGSTTTAAIASIHEVTKETVMSASDAAKYFSEAFGENNRTAIENNIGSIQELVDHYHALVDAGQPVDENLKALAEAYENSSYAIRESESAITELENQLASLDYSVSLTDEQVATLTNQFPALSSVIDGSAGSFSANIVNMLAQANAAGDDVSALASLISSMIGVSGTVIDTSGQQQSLANLANIALQTATALDAVFGTGGAYSDRTRTWSPPSISTSKGDSRGGGGGRSSSSSARSVAQSRKSDMDAILSYLKYEADETLDDINEKIDAINEKYDAEISALEESNAELETQLELEKRLADLETARAKKVLVFQNGQFQYVGDQDAVSSAQKSLNEYNRKKELEDQKKYINEKRRLELQDLEAEKKRWEDYKNQLGEVSKAYELEYGKMLAEQRGYTAGAKDDWDTRISNLNDFKDDYIAAVQEIKAASDELGGINVGGGVPSIGGGGSGGSTAGGSTDDIVHAIISGNTVYLPNNTSITLQEWSRLTRMAKDEDKDAIRTLMGYGFPYKQIIEGRYENGTSDAPGGLSIVGEKGPEMRVLNRHDGIIPAEITKNLMQIGSHPEKFMQQVSGGYTLNISNVSLPGVSNADQFVAGLKNLALQRAYKRG